MIKKIKEKLANAGRWIKKKAKQILISLGIITVVAYAMVGQPPKQYKDYKFWYIHRDDDGYILDAGIRFYEGEYRKVQIENIKGEKEQVTQYIRTKRLTKNDLQDLGEEFTKEFNNTDAKIYYPSDFGKIKTDDELREFLDKELAKIKGREAINEQKIK